MQELLEILGLVDHGVITTRMLRAAGLDPRTVQRAIACGMLVRIRQGAYATAASWKTAGADERYRLLVIATARCSAHPLVVSHLSAAAMHGLPTIGAWPTTVHTLEPGAGGGSSTPFVTSHRRGPDADLVEIDGVIVTSLARTLVDVAATNSLVRAVTAMDAALHTALVEAGPAGPALTHETLLAELDAVAPKQRYRQAEEAIRFSDGRSESAGESISRVRIVELGFEPPELQVRFPGILGRTAVVDFWWPRVRKAGEFDGKLKYVRGAILAEGQDPGEVVWKEKRREDALRRTAIDSMARWVWDEVLSTPTFHRILLDADVPRARRSA